jgi:hypothetical protein
MKSTKIYLKLFLLSILAGMKTLTNIYKSYGMNAMEQQLSGVFLELVSIVLSIKNVMSELFFTTCQSTFSLNRCWLMELLTWECFQGTVFLDLVLTPKTHQMRFKNCVQEHSSILNHLFVMALSPLMFWWVNWKLRWVHLWLRITPLSCLLVPLMNTVVEV